MWPELGFSAHDREENVRRMGELALMTQKAKTIAVVACIAPFNAWRNRIRRKTRTFIEVFVSCPLEVCRRRDVKGFYAKADRGKLSGLTGVDSPYEPPTNPEVVVKTDISSISECLGKIMSYVQARRNDRNI
jgi:adenylylsulfate kinase